MSAFLEWLEKLNERDTRVRAVLRRSLAFAPGTFPAAFPYVEPFLKDGAADRQRQMHYLVAALWAAHWKAGRPGERLPIGKAAAIHQIVSRSANTERRFIALLDADPEQLPHRLRQMVALLKDQNLDFDTLLTDLLRWEDDSKCKQNEWARQFYRTLNPTSDLKQEAETEEESA